MGIAGFQAGMKLRAWLEPVNDATDERHRILTSLRFRRRLPQFRETSLVRLNGRNDAVDHILDEDNFILGQAEILISPLVDFREQRVFAAIHREGRVGLSSFLADDGDELGGGRLGTFGLGQVISRWKWQMDKARLLDLRTF